MVDSQHVVVGTLSAGGGGVVSGAVGDGSGNTYTYTLVISVEAGVTLDASEWVCYCGDGAVADGVGYAVGDSTGGLETEVGFANTTSVDRLVGDTILGGGGDATAGVGQEESRDAVSASVVSGVEGAVVDHGRENASVVGEVAGSVARGTDGAISVSGATDNTVREAHTSGLIGG